MKEAKGFRKKGTLEGKAEKERAVSSGVWRSLHQKRGNVYCLHVIES